MNKPSTQDEHLNAGYKFVGAITPSRNWRGLDELSLDGVFVGAERISCALSSEALSGTGLSTCEPKLFVYVKYTPEREKELKQIAAKRNEGPVVQPFTIVKHDKSGGFSYRDFHGKISA